MNKTFYKRQPVRKTYFNKNVNVRSHAYGSNVLADYLEWQRYYYSASGSAGDKMIIAPQGSIVGTTASAKGVPVLASCLGELLFNSLRLSLDGGYVAINGKRSAVYLGPEILGWAILTASAKSTKTNFLSVIGRHAEGSEITLSLYRMTSRGPEEAAFVRRPMPSTTARESYIICLGQHVLTVHDSKLDYLYFNTKTMELETVAIGEDSENALHPECNLVSPKIVTTTSGYVFWIASGQVCGFAVGYPSRLIHIDGSEYENTYDIGCSQDSLLVYRKSKNTSKVVCTRYSRNSDGTFVGRALGMGTQDGFVRR